MMDPRENSILDSVAEDLFSTMPLIGRSIRRKLLKAALTGFHEDIDPPHFEIIKLLEEVGMLHIAEIGERLQIARPQMTHLIDKLVGLGIAERQTGKEDRRMINVTLTEKGKTIIKEHDDQIRKATMDALSSLTVGELKDLSASLRTLREIFSKLQ
jgi:DNA-binding MarR family transcriptional regulator